MAQGSCLCGNIKYEYSGEPAMKVTRRLFATALPAVRVTGSTYSVCLLVPEDKFKFTSGTPKQAAITHENGMGIKLSFCGDCGSPLCKVADAEAYRGLNIVFGGTLDDQDALEKAKPGGELWIKYRPTWVSEVEGAGQMQAFS